MSKQPQGPRIKYLKLLLLWIVAMAFVFLILPGLIGGIMYGIHGP